MARISVDLARAIRAQHGHELAVRDRQADVMQRLDAPVARRKLPGPRERDGHFTTLTLPADDACEQERVDGDALMHGRRHVVDAGRALEAGDGLELIADLGTLEALALLDGLGRELHRRPSRAPPSSDRDRCIWPSTAPRNLVISAFSAPSGSAS